MRIAIVLFVTAILLLQFIASKKRCSVISFIIIAIVIMGLLSLLAVFLRLNPTFDIARHYISIDSVRDSSYSFFGFIERGWQITNWNYKYTYIFNALIYVIARFFPNWVLPIVSIVVCYSLFTYICIEEFKPQMEFRSITISIAMLSVLLPYIFIYSNVRNPLASSIVAFGVYKFEKDNKALWLLICSIIGVFLHPVSVVLVPFILLRKVSVGIKGILIPVFISKILLWIMEFLYNNAPNDFLYRIALKFHNYFLVRTDNQGRGWIYSEIIILIIIYALDTLDRGKQVSNKEGLDYRGRIKNTVVWFSVFSLGFVNRYELILRLPYSIAVLSPVLVNTLFDKRQDKTLQKSSVLASELILCLLAILGVALNIDRLKP